MQTPPPAPKTPTTAQDSRDRVNASIAKAYPHGLLGHLKRRPRPLVKAGSVVITEP